MVLFWASLGTRVVAALLPALFSPARWGSGVSSFCRQLCAHVFVCNFGCKFLYCRSHPGGGKSYCVSRQFMPTWQMPMCLDNVLMAWQLTFFPSFVVRVLPVPCVASVPRPSCLSCCSAFVRCLGVPYILLSFCVFCLSFFDFVLSAHVIPSFLFSFCPVPVIFESMPQLM